MLYPQGIFRHALNRFCDAMSVGRAPEQRAQDQHVQGTVDQLYAVVCTSLSHPAEFVSRMRSKVYYYY